MSTTYRIGTCHFISRDAAYDYYRPYHCDSGTDPMHGGRVLNGASLRQFVDQKIRDGEIKIGPPSIGLGERLLVDKREGRYIIETAAQ